MRGFSLTLTVNQRWPGRRQRQQLSTNGVGRSISADWITAIRAGLVWPA